MNTEYVAPFKNKKKIVPVKVDDIWIFKKSQEPQSWHYAQQSIINIASTVLNCILNASNALISFNISYVGHIHFGCNNIHPTVTSEMCSIFGAHCSWLISTKSASEILMNYAHLIVEKQKLKID